MRQKIKVLRIINTLDSKFGGPSVAIIDSSKILARNGFIVDIVTNDTKNFISTNQKNLNIIKLGPSFGKYGFNIKLFFWLLKNRKRYKIFIVHGIWQFNSLISRILIKNKYFIFLHGMLNPYFSSEKYKKIKKKIYWFLFEKKNLKNSISILLTSNGEKQTLKKTFVDTSGLKSNVIKYGILKPKMNLKNSKKIFYRRFFNLKSKVFFIYMGRFHPMKGCEILLNSVRKVLDKNIEIYVLMVGPYNDYQTKLLQLSKKLNLTKNIFWSDFLSGKLKWGALSSAEAMVLPSHAENFGVSLAESLSVGVPVITTNKVNIYKEIQNSKAGYISKDNVESFTKSLIKFIKQKNKKKIKKNSLDCFNKNFNLEFNQQKLITLLKKNI